jgi:hypothetical protein
MKTCPGENTPANVLAAAVSVLIFFPAVVCIGGIVLLYAFYRICGNMLRKTFRRRESARKNIREGETQPARKKN